MKTRRQTRNTGTQRGRQQTATGAQVSPRQKAPHVPKINFRIERLTLEGYTRADRARFTQTFEKRMRELVTAARGVNWAGAKGAERIDAGTLPPAATPEQAARHIARKIFLSLRQEPRQTKEIAHA